MKKTYSTICICENCWKDVKIKIPFGTKSEGFRAVCPNCGVKMVLGKLKEGKNDRRR